MSYRFLYEARAEFDSATDWYEARQAGLGDDFIAEGSSCVQRIVGSPQLYGRIRGCPAGRDFRVAPIDRFAYLIIYEPCGTEIVILAVSHARSASRAWKRRSP